MMKIVTTFAIVFAIVFFGIQGFRALTGKEKLAVGKLLAYSAVCSAITLAILTTIVILF